VPFTDFSLHPLILRALETEGYVEPTPVQAAAIPCAIEGRDLLATAQTGTGKTAAFLLPSLNRLSGERPPRPAGQPRVLVMVPTRELARQVLIAARTLGTYLRLNCVELTGGMPFRDQIRSISKAVDIVVATPGRLRDHMGSGRLHLNEVEVLILDEADRMLDMGFQEDMEAVIAACPRKRQTMLFTATMDAKLGKLASGQLKDPVRVEIAPSETALKITQRAHPSDGLPHKRKMLHAYAAMPEVEKAIVFAATKRDADFLARDLAEAGHAAAALHGDMSQAERHRTLDSLRKSQIRLLVATDVAARGLDVADISHVINFDLPPVPEDYVHRIGRTGRNGAEGVAISFVGPADREALQRIEKYTKSSLSLQSLPGLEPRKGPKPGAKPVVKPTGKFAGKSAGKPVGKTGGKPVGKTGGKPSGKPSPNKPGPSKSGPSKSGKPGGNQPLTRKTTGRGK